jgi:hypothetical protein
MCYRYEHILYLARDALLLVYSFVLVAARATPSDSRQKSICCDIFPDLYMAVLVVSSNRR